MGRKVPYEIREKIKNEYISGISIKCLSKKYKLNEMTIRKIINSKLSKMVKELWNR
jgi:Mor family transcriptional regulator